jgi:hypothetical protein
MAFRIHGLSVNREMSKWQCEPTFRRNLMPLVLKKKVSSSETSVGFTISAHVLCVKDLQLLDSMKVTVFWDVAPCSLVEIDRCFRSAYCVHETTRRNIPEDSHFYSPP